MEEKIETIPITMERLFSLMGKIVPDHITQGDFIDGEDYFIARRSIHDGSGNFTADLFFHAFMGLMFKTSCKVGSGYNPNIHDIRYEVGQIIWTITYGMQELPIGRRPGQIDMIRIPVKMFLSPKET